ncbi:CU044_5270 family protein [Aeromicrobium fastidiosum]|uniref:CU044_5270 family protein n=1 Tax=Aeromicrobium fastidiosum TaxID=52699 RepID=A0A641AHK6_9ACTN|nr:CU044_5270 family protein [Aeromicrobium fastidiosum]KAA1373580.1 hypothetical protein ESP62_016585 [Aeromicrobium fastidiosum]MBP2391127.1 hypothetical protein [Aeromicrobium fastidiosum]
MSTLERVIDDLRPAHEPLDAEWSADTLTAIMAQPVRPKRRRRRLAVAATLVGVVTVPVMLSGGSASARAELLSLAVVAARADGPVITPGTYLHVRTESLQVNSSVLGDGKRLDTNRESWTRWDGDMVAIDTRPSAGWTEHHRFTHDPDDIGFGSPSPEFVASLPDTPDALRRYLDRTVSGSNSHEEALFVAISDLAYSRMLDPHTFATALRVLADVRGVSTDDVEVDGRPAVEVQYDRFFGLGFVSRSSFTVDTETAQLLRMSETSPSSDYTSRTRSVEVVDEVPPEVLADLDRYGNGSRICTDGSEARDTESPEDTCS